MEAIVQIGVSLLGVYAGIGVLFSIYFFFKGAFQIDAIVVDSKWTVRLLLIPGAIGLWPLLLKRIIFKSKSAHI